jgi:excisionase family DNA binding protein
VNNGGAVQREPQLYRVDEAANQLSVGRTFLWGLISKGEIRAVKVGRATRIPASEIRRFVAKLTARSQ